MTIEHFLWKGGGRGIYQVQVIKHSGDLNSSFKEWFKWLIPSRMSSSTRSLKMIIKSSDFLSEPKGFLCRLAHTQLLELCLGFAES